ACALPFYDLAVSRRPCGGRRAETAAFWRLELGPPLRHGGGRSRRRVGKVTLLRLRRRCDPGPAVGVAAGLDGHLSTSDVQLSTVRPLQHVYFHDLYCRISDRDE